MRAGAHCVKLEGGSKRVPMVSAIVDAEVPVMGHIGLTPQSANAMGGFRVQGRGADEARALVDDAIALEQAGCFAVVIEGVPDVVGRMVTDAIDIPTIGIGAGADTDGQVLVYHDLVGSRTGSSPSSCVVTAPASTIRWRRSASTPPTCARAISLDPTRRTRPATASSKRSASTARTIRGERADASGDQDGDAGG